jgi:hypothetical protein
MLRLPISLQIMGPNWANYKSVLKEATFDQLKGEMVLLIEFASQAPYHEKLMIAGTLITEELIYRNFKE